MNLVGLMAWYDEPTDLLTESVASLAPHLDRMVAVDGAYSYFPDGRAQSPLVQGRAITNALRHARCLNFDIHAPRKVWVDEIEKRTAMFQLAERHTTADDWYIIWDADMVLERADGLRQSLADAGEHGSASFMLRSTSASREMPWIRHRMAHRAVRGLKAIGSHSVYGYERDRKTHYVWGHQFAPEALDLSDSVLVVHDPGRRSAKRLAAKEISDQRAHRLEVGDLDPPHF